MYIPENGENYLGNLNEENCLKKVKKKHSYLYSFQNLFRDISIIDNNEWIYCI